MGVWEGARVSLWVAASESGRVEKWELERDETESGEERRACGPAYGLLTDTYILGKIRSNKKKVENTIPFKSWNNIIFFMEFCFMLER